MDLWLVDYSCVFIAATTAMYSFWYELQTLIAAPLSTQPTILCGMAKLVPAFIENDNKWQCRESSSQPKVKT